MTLDAFVRTMIVDQLAGADASTVGGHPPAGEEIDRAIDEVFDTVDVPPGVGGGAMRRENWYR